MRGQAVRAHYQLSLELREGQALRKLLQDALADPEWGMNEQEEELAQGILEVLERDPNPQDTSSL